MLDVHERSLVVSDEEKDHRGTVKEIIYYEVEDNSKLFELCYEKINSTGF